MTAWFRRQDGGLVAAQHPEQQILFFRRGYQEVPEDEAVAEVESGKQAELNAERRGADINARERRLAAEQQRKAEARHAAAQRLVADAQRPEPTESTKTCAACGVSWNAPVDACPECGVKIEKPKE